MRKIHIFIELLVLISIVLLIWTLYSTSDSTIPIHNEIASPIANIPDKNVKNKHTKHKIFPQFPTIDKNISLVSQQSLHSSYIKGDELKDENISLTLRVKDFDSNQKAKKMIQDLLQYKMKSYTLKLGNNRWRVFVGPFINTEYMQKIRKKIEMIYNIKPSIYRYFP